MITPPKNWAFPLIIWSPVWVLDLVCARIESFFLVREMKILLLNVSHTGYEWLRSFSFGVMSWGSGSSGGGGSRSLFASSAEPGSWARLRRRRRRAPTCCRFKALIKPTNMTSLGMCGSKGCFLGACQGLILCLVLSCFALQCFHL